MKIQALDAVSLKISMLALFFFAMFSNRMLKFRKMLDDKWSFR